MTRTSPPARANRIGTSPPGPHMCGSTTWSTKPAATAASNALPPASRRRIPAEEASQWVDATMPYVPTSSGRVLKLMRSQSQNRARTARLEFQ
jgi:hypothetical protein